MLLDHSLTELSQLLKTKKISSVDLVNEAYDQIEKLDTQLHSFITLRPKPEVIKEAEEKDSQRSRVIGTQTAKAATQTEAIENNPLYGIPYSMKDCYLSQNLRTTCGSRVLDNFIPPYNSTVYQKLSAAGAILIGKNNLDAWGHGGSTENTDYTPARNPWDITRIPGGSSGGPAIAIATRMVAFAIGEDTGGSIRNPASMCNISGLKVTYGRVSRYGTIPYAASLDTVGPMAKIAEDLAIILECIAGQDPLDASSSHQMVEKYAARLQTEGMSATAARATAFAKGAKGNTYLKGKTFGLPKEYFAEGLDSEVRQVVMRACETLKQMGGKIVDVSIPYLQYGVSLYYLTAMSETSSNMARYDGIRFGFSREQLSAETKRRILLGTYALSAGYADEYYKKAQRARTVLLTEFAKAFEQCDVLLSPITPSKPAKIGELINNPLQSYLEDLYTGPINLVGSPSIALPAGFSSEGLPIGMQFIGKKFAESELLALAHAYQQQTEWHKKMPPIAGGI